MENLETNANIYGNKEKNKEIRYKSPQISWQQAEGSH